ncbi:cytochrome P450 [Apiospora rasikravindrae]|uniref:Cytochrome P450 n=1 Tax=Apiospora rasikravindrae TaxID=990691 RepID=A0ABR1T0F8_9PEZI
MDTIFQYIVCFIIALFVAVVGNRLVIHPLRAYPGPLLGRLTNGYAGWHAIKGDVHLMTYRDHLKYGPVVRQAPNRLVFNTLAAVQDIYLSPLIAKAPIYTFTRFRGVTPSVFTALDKPDHRRRRRAVGQAISERSMRSFEPTMLSQIDVFLLQLLRSCRPNQPQVVDMTPRCKYLAMDIIGHLAFGHAFRTQTDETLRLIPRAFAGLNPVVYLFMNWPKTHRLVDPAVQWLLRARVGAFRRVLAGVVSDRMALPRDAKHDLYSLVATDERVGQAQLEGIRRSEIWGRRVFFLMRVCGTTTGTAICSVFYYLSRYSAAYARLASEIRTTFSSGSEIRQGPQLASCKYLRAVIDETLRICPPTPGVMWREKDPLSPEPLVVDGHVIPPGTLVGVGTYSLMHNPEYFPEPFSFRPQRWLDGAVEEGPKEKEARTAMRRAFIPFSLGDRGCAGKAVAYLEMSLTVAKTLWYFDFEKAPAEAGDVGSGRRGATEGRDRPDEYQLHDSFMADHQGPNLVFRARADYWGDLIKTSE